MRRHSQLGHAVLTAALQNALRSIVASPGWAEPYRTRLGISA